MEKVLDGLGNLDQSPEAIYSFMYSGGWDLVEDRRNEFIKTVPADQVDSWNARFDKMESDYKNRMLTGFFERKISKGENLTPNDLITFGVSQEDEEKAKAMWRVMNARVGR